MNKEDGGQAFPLYEPSDGMHAPYCNAGMSLRDYFAAQSIAANADTARTALEYERLAERAYILADAMLKARAE